MTTVGSATCVSACSSSREAGTSSALTEPETEPGSFTPGWLMALVAPAAPGAEGTTEDAPTVAQLSLPEPEVDTVMEEPAVAPEPFDWTERTWGPEVTMSAVELPEVEEPYEPRVVEIEVPGAVEDEVATLAEPANEQGQQAAHEQQPRGGDGAMRSRRDTRGVSAEGDGARGGVVRCRRVRHREQHRRVRRRSGARAPCVSPSFEDSAQLRV